MPENFRPQNMEKPQTSLEKLANLIDGITGPVELNEAGWDENKALIKNFISSVKHGEYIGASLILTNSNLSKTKSLSSKINAYVINETVKLLNGDHGDIYNALYLAESLRSLTNIIQSSEVKDSAKKILFKLYSDGSFGLINRIIDTFGVEESFLNTPEIKKAKEIGLKKFISETYDTDDISENILSHGQDIISEHFFDSILVDEELLPEVRATLESFKKLAKIKNIVQPKIENSEYFEQIRSPIYLCAYSAINIIGQIQKAKNISFEDSIKLLTENYPSKNLKDIVRYVGDQKILSQLSYLLKRTKDQNISLSSEEDIINIICEKIVPFLENETEFAKFYALPTQGIEVEVMKNTGRRKLERIDWDITNLIHIKEDEGERGSQAYEMSTEPSMAIAPQKLLLNYLSASGFIDEKFISKEYTHKTTTYSMHISTTFDRSYKRMGGFLENYADLSKTLGITYSSFGRFKERGFKFGGTLSGMHGIIADKSSSGKLKDIGKMKTTKEDDINENALTAFDEVLDKTDTPLLIEMRCFDVNEKWHYQLLTRKQLFDYGINCLYKNNRNDIEDKIAKIYDEFSRKIADLTFDKEIGWAYEWLEGKKSIEPIKNKLEDFEKVQKTVREVVNNYAMQIHRALQDDWKTVSNEKYATA